MSRLQAFGLERTTKKIAVLSLILVLLGTSCAVNPVTGKRELMLISEQEEIALGKNTDKEIGAQYGLYDDPELLAYVQSVGKRLVPHTHRPNLPYQFAILDTSVINAFAVPGGYVYVTRGILALMSSEAELSAVLGHELGHVNARHSVRRMSQMLIVQLGLAVGSALSDTVAKISGVASIGMQLLFLKYSRDDEREADALGIDYSRKGAYNPGEMVAFFSSLQKMGDLSGGHSLPGFLSTHPLTSERIQNVKSMLSDTDAGLAVRKEDYLRRADGMIYGDDPRQGYAEDNAFYHPQLLFTFEIPADWKVQNTPAQVSLSTENGNAALILQAEKSGERLEAFARKEAESIEGRTFISERAATINGLAAFEQTYDIAQAEKETLRVRLSYIQKGGLIYRFSSLSTSQNFQTYDGTFQRVVHSFKDLKDPRHLNRQPRRLKLVRADGSSSLEDYFKQAGMDQKGWPQAAILNGMTPGETPARNQWVKTVK